MNNRETWSLIFVGAAIGALAAGYFPAGFVALIVAAVLGFDG